MDYSLLVGIAQRRRRSENDDEREEEEEKEEKEEEEKEEKKKREKNPWSFCLGGMPSSDGKEIYYVSIIDIL